MLGTRLAALGFAPINGNRIPVLKLARIKSCSRECFFNDYGFFEHLPGGTLIFTFFKIAFFEMRRTQARSSVSFQLRNFMKSDVRRTQARDHFFAFSLFSHWTSAESRNRHSHALRSSLFFLAAVAVPVHILDFFNTSPVRIVFL